jgi:hypothetical protein
MKKKPTIPPVKNLPQANSPHTPPGPWVVVRPSRRKGPAPGSVDRYGASDRALYRELKRLINEEHLSATAASLKLAEADKVSGIGAKKSRARRLARRYLADSR